MKTLPRLLAEWSRTVTDVERSYPLTYDDYLNDLDGRRALEHAARDAEQPPAWHEALAALDDRFRDATFESPTCAWGDDVAADEGWTAESHWYYWRHPIRHEGAWFD